MRMFGMFPVSSVRVVRCVTLAEQRCAGICAAEPERLRHQNTQGPLRRALHWTAGHTQTRPIPKQTAAGRNLVPGTLRLALARMNGLPSVPVPDTHSGMKRMTLRVGSGQSGSQL